jgi:hypothetical protein
VREGGVLEHETIQIAEGVATTVNRSLQLAAVALGREGPCCPDGPSGKYRVDDVQKRVHRDWARCDALGVVLVVYSSSI